LFEREEVMKKFMFVLMMAAVLLFTAAPLFAEGILFGVKGGLNMTDVTGDDAPEASMKMGFGGGIFFNYAFTELFAVQVEGLYMMKGATEDVTEEDLTFEASWNINYIEIPLLLKVNIPTEGKIKPAIFAGPTFGFLMSAEVEVEGETVDIKDELESMDIGILGGAEIGYKMEKGMLFLSASYEIGMMSIAKTEGDEEEVDVKNSNIGVYLGYGFPF
jgi:hypothetical protein